MHVYEERFPVDPAWPVPPPNAPASEYRLVQRELGLQRCVVVQPNAYGFDNRCTLEGIRDLGPHARGIATVNWPGSATVTAIILNDVPGAAAQIARARSTREPNSSGAGL